MNQLKADNKALTKYKAEMESEKKASVTEREEELLAKIQALEAENQIQKAQIEEANEYEYEVLERIKENLSKQKSFD